MEEVITHVFSQYAYSPFLVYGALCLFMVLSAFGLPIPEEVVLISASFVAYMALNPQLYPPPSPDAIGVNVYVLAVVAFLAVVGSDFLIYFLGKKVGPRLFRMKFFSRLVSDSALDRIQSWTRRYGYWAVILFRFTPGVRFPGHLMCGAMGLSPWRFLAIDTIAAGFSVPTQVLLVSFYGKEILQQLGRFKLVLLSVLAVLFVIFMVRRLREKRRALKLQPPEEAQAITHAETKTTSSEAK
jgi:membrane protein DedA with SNARE-associated domain